MEQIETFDLRENGFAKFDPMSDGKTVIPDAPGNYVVVLREDAFLPPINIEPIYTLVDFEGTLYRVIYTGSASGSLRKRDYEQHFTKNNAGQSTLRKSLGSLMGLKKIPRDKNKPEKGNTKFGEADETALSGWMQSNLLLFFKTDRNFEEAEKKLINELNPPLNIMSNANEINREYRKMLSALRSSK